MLARSVLGHILDDDTLTRHLGDAEARVLIEWLVEEAERADHTTQSPGVLESEVRQLCRRARVIARFVRLWALEGQPGAAAQLSAAERLDWPLPDGPIDACSLMLRVVRWEARRRAA